MTKLAQVALVLLVALWSMPAATAHGHAPGHAPAPMHARGVSSTHTNATSTSCHGRPPAYPGASWGSCCDKSTCFAYCTNGRTGVVKAECIDGTWRVSGQCQPRMGACNGLPPAVQGIAWSPRCDGKTYCGSNCLPGYTGYVYSTCVNGQWKQPYGRCLPKQQHCWGSLPKVVSGKPWSRSCIGKASCSTQCSHGMTGSYLATCVNGQWQVSGGCTSRQMFGWHS